MKDLKFMTYLRVCKACKHSIGNHRMTGGCAEKDCFCTYKWDAVHGVAPQ